MQPSERSKKLLAQLQNKEIGLSEFLNECVCWSLSEGFDELKPRSLPLKSPKVSEMEIKYQGRDDADWNKIYQTYPEVKGYYIQKHEVENWNQGTKDWLEEMLRIDPTLTKVKERLELFKVKENPLIAKAKETFNATEA
jgi:hypothetical protein